MVRLPCSSPCTGSTSSSPCCPHISWTTAGASDRLRHTRKHHRDLPDECLHPLHFHLLPDSHTPDTSSDTHTTPCVAVMRRVLRVKLQHKRADAYVRTFSHSFAEQLPRSLLCGPRDITNGLDHLAPYFMPERTRRSRLLNPLRGLLAPI